MAELLPTLKQRFFDVNGVPLVGGQLFSYAAGTTTPLATFTDQSGSSANTNPVILDADGEADIWMGGLSYKFVLQDSTGVVQWTVDNVRAPGTSSSAITFTHGLLDLPSLKAIDPGSRSEGLSVFVESMNAFYYFSASSSATGDDLTVIQPTSGTGRWLRIGDLNVIFSVANNQSSSNVTGLIFDKTLIRSAEIHYQVYRAATSSVAQKGILLVIYNGSTWELVSSGQAGDANTVFDINTSSGQVIYTTDNMSGVYDTTNSLMKYNVKYMEI